MVYEGKHAKRESADGAGNHDGAYRPDDHETPQRGNEAMPLSDVTFDSLEEEESQDGLSSHLGMHRLLGSIHLQGIRLQSPIYFDGSQRLRTTSVRETFSGSLRPTCSRRTSAANPCMRRQLRRRNRPWRRILTAPVLITNIIRFY